MNSKDILDIYCVAILVLVAALKVLEISPF